MTRVEFGQAQINQMLALRAAATNIIYTIDAFMHGVDGQMKAQETNTDANKCLHPRNMLRPAPAMGQPNRAYCGGCGAEVEIT